MPHFEWLAENPIFAVLFFQKVNYLKDLTYEIYEVKIEIKLCQLAFRQVM